MSDIKVERILVSSDKDASDFVMSKVKDMIENDIPIQVINYIIADCMDEIVVLCKMSKCNYYGKPLIFNYGPEGLCCYGTNILMWFDQESLAKIENSIVDAKIEGTQIEQFEALVNRLFDIANRIVIDECGQLKF